VIARALALAAALAGVAAPAAQAAAPPPLDFLGVSSEDAFAGTEAERERSFSGQAKAGVRLVRQPFRWAEIARGAGTYELGAHDVFVATAARYGIRVMPILFGGPDSRGRMPELARVLARRYGPLGSLWDERPDLPRLPVRSWQVWNEPSLRRYWPPRPSARGYARMLRRVSAVLRAEDPVAEVLTAGLPASRLRQAVPIRRYLRALLRSRAPFDTLAFNAYARDVPELVRNLREVRRLLNRAGRRRTRIWITELGWSDVGPRSRFRAGRRGQARLIRNAFRAIERERGRLRVRGVVYHSWLDGRPYAPDFHDFWGLHTGLNRLNGRPKPALRAFTRTARRLGWRR